MVMRYTVIVSPRVTVKLADQADYLALHSSPAVSDAYMDGLMDYLLGLDTFPERGHPRHDVLPGLWVIGYGASANLAVVVQPPQVYVVGVFFGGENYEHELRALNESALLA